MDDLIDAKKRWIKVHILLDRQDPNSPFFDKDFASINELTFKHLSKAGIEVRMDSPKTTTHAKVVVIDRKITIVGSHNLTASAFKNNNELSLMIESPTLAKDILDYLSRIETINPSIPSQILH